MCSKLYKIGCKYSSSIPDIKKIEVVKKYGVKDKVPVRFRRETLKVLHLKFLAENPKKKYLLLTFRKISRLILLSYQS